ncbi:Gfo/Idh/MocA family oxidoreductase [candidate division KSB1 bacterium]|nr:Gfo/Idh/MocA family oxidoreductase [candidate division KSB1 bacterium]MBL7094194.1 Gfo/Idh/MocA family oxidoreductase [candidate division KSB1 bacterium]
MSDKNKLGIGIVGCGAISDIHARAILESDKIDLISVYSRNLKNAKRVGEQYGVSYSNDWDIFVNDESLDIVSICTPSGNHLDYGELAAEAGKHVVVEKPIDVTVERGKQLIDVCKKNSVKLAVIFQSRFLDSAIQIKDAIDSRKLGKIFHGSAYIKWFRSQEYYDSGEWRGTLALDGGGVLINQAIHTIDLLQWMMGDVETVYGHTGIFTHKNIEGEDNAAAVLKFKNGALGIIEGSTSVLPAMDRRIEIHGKKGTAILTGDNVSISIGESDKNQDEAEAKGSGAASPLAGFSIVPHQKQFEAIVEAIQNNEKPPVTGKDSLKSLAIVEAVYKSSKTGLVVKMADLL